MMYYATIENKTKTNSPHRVSSTVFTARIYSMLTNTHQVNTLFKQ